MFDLGKSSCLDIEQATRCQPHSDRTPGFQLPLRHKLLLTLTCHGCSAIAHVTYLWMHENKFSRAIALGNIGQDKNPPYS